MAGAGRGWQNKRKSSGNAPGPVAPATGRGAGTSFFLFGKFSNFDHTGREQLIQIPYSFCLKEYVSFLPLRDMLN